jgi:hypothetical protein
VAVTAWAREFIRIAPRSSMAGETEYAFWHVLVREVAYRALPRSARASRHLAVSRWIEARAGDRVEDVADVLAHHYSTALDLARAVGDDRQSSELEAPALRFLLLAGERALDLDVSAAVGLLERALALTPPGHPDRSRCRRPRCVDEPPSRDLGIELIGSEPGPPPPGARRSSRATVSSVSGSMYL